MSGSAVLEVSCCDDSSDGSAESSRMESTLEETRELDGCVPLLMQQGYDIVVKVDAPMKQLSTMETFVTYRVRCACARWTAPPYVRRRYNHFKALRQRLVASHPLLPAPPLPPLHTARQQLDRYSPSFVAIRTQALNAFLDRVAKHPILTHSEDLKLFLIESEEAVEKALRNEGGSLTGLWGLTGVFYGMGGGEGKPQHTVARVKDPEFTAASDHLQSLQSKLSTLGALTARLYKDSSALGKEMCTMKPITDAWCSHERGPLAVATRAVGAGASVAGTARAVHGSVTARALLPQLAAYAGVVRGKILDRDMLHATYASSNHTAESVHNRLEQASEALRSELTDWNAKTSAEIKTLLLDIADKQLLIHQQSVLAWENALRACREHPSNIEDVFKTVSKTAVSKLSPTRAKDIARSTDIGVNEDLGLEFDDFEDEEVNDRVGSLLGHAGSPGRGTSLEQIELPLEQEGSPLEPNDSIHDQIESPVGPGTLLGQIGSSLDQIDIHLEQDGSQLRQNESILGQVGSSLEQDGSRFEQNESMLGQIDSPEGRRSAESDPNDVIFKDIIKSSSDGHQTLKNGQNTEGHFHKTLENGETTFISDPLSELADIDLSRVDS